MVLFFGVIVESNLVTIKKEREFHRLIGGKKNVMSETQL